MNKLTPCLPKKSFDELLKENKDYQSAFDKRITQSLQTAKIKWEAEQERNRANKAENELNAYKLKIQLINEIVKEVCKQ